MKKLLCSVVLFAGMAGLVSTSTISVAPAQDKTKKDTKPSGKAGSVEVNEGKDGKFRFTVRDGDGKFLALSGVFATKEEAMKGIDALKEVLPKATVKTAAKKTK